MAGNACSSAVQLTGRENDATGAGFLDPGPVGAAALAFGGDVTAQLYEGGSVNWLQAAGAGVGAALGAGLGSQIFTSEGGVDEALGKGYTDLFGGMEALFGEAAGSGSGGSGCGCQN